MGTGLCIVHHQHLDLSTYPVSTNNNLSASEYEQPPFKEKRFVLILHTTLVAATLHLDGFSGLFQTQDPGWWCWSCFIVQFAGNGTWPRAPCLPSRTLPECVWRDGWFNLRTLTSQYTTGVQTVWLGSGECLAIIHTHSHTVVYGNRALSNKTWSGGNTWMIP